MSQAEPETVNVMKARHESIGFESLSAVERDVLVVAISINQRRDPREPAHFDEVADEIGVWYDRHITPESVEDVLLALDDQDYLDCVGTGAFEVTTNGLELAEAYLRQFGNHWRNVLPWESGSKLVVEQRREPLQ